MTLRDNFNDKKKMSFLSRIFKKNKKEIQDSLEEAEKLGFITKEERLKLRLERAENTYKDFLNKDQKKKK